VQRISSIKVSVTSAERLDKASSVEDLKHTLVASQLNDYKSRSVEKHLLIEDKSQSPPLFKHSEKLLESFSSLNRDFIPELNSSFPKQDHEFRILKPNLNPKIKI
jgi:hypothetical protein